MRAEVSNDSLKDQYCLFSEHMEFSSASLKAGLMGVVLAVANWNQEDQHRSTWSSFLNRSGIQHPKKQSDITALGGHIQSKGNMERGVGKLP